MYRLLVTVYDNFEMSTFAAMICNVAITGLS